MGVWKNDIPLGAYYSKDGDYIAFSAKGELYGVDNGGAGYITSDGMHVLASDLGDLGTHPWTPYNGLLFNTIGSYGSVDAMGIVQTEFDNMFVDLQYYDMDGRSEGGNNFA